MIRKLSHTLKNINPWHFVWIILLFAQMIILVMNTLQSLLWWGYISRDLLFIGIIDTFISTIIITPIAIYFVRHTAKIEAMNRQLEIEIAERKQIEEALKEAMEEQRKLEAQLLQAQKLEAIGTLAGGIAHDFNNMLSAIMMYANFLLMKSPSDFQKGHLESIMRISDKAANLVKGLLSFSRKQVMNPKPIDLNHIIKKLADLLRRIIGENIDLKIDLTEQELIIMADAAYIDQVLINLTTNAKDAIRDAGILTISTSISKMAENVPDYNMNDNRRYALITFSDNGEGMNDHTRQRIFEPFFTTKDVGKGTGLGLATAYGIINQHKGHIFCTSTSGMGTTFRIYLPLVNAKVQQTEPEKTYQDKAGTGTLLLAEDDEEVRASAKITLSEAGYSVLEAIDGEDALERFADSMTCQTDIRLLILDMMMPKINGWEVFTKIRQNYPATKILFISGYSYDIMHERGILEKDIPFIQKPFLPHVLLEKVRIILETPAA